MNNQEIVVGIDVSKNTLDVAFGSDDPNPLHLDYTDEGLAKLLTALKEKKPRLIVLESTGGIENRLLAQCWQAGLPVVRVLPNRTRHFAQAMGYLAKTDKIDARMLAHYGETAKLEAMATPDEHQLRFRALISRRSQLLEMSVAERNRWTTAPEVIQPYIQSHIEWLEKEIEKIEKELDDLLKQFPTVQATFDILDSVPGIGKTTAFSLIAYLPELGYVSNKTIALLVGVAPLCRDSGTKRGHRAIYGGRAEIRRVLYMATISAIRFNPIIREFYQRLCATGKPSKVAIVACMRKLLVILNAMVRDGEPWRCPAAQASAG